MSKNSEVKQNLFDKQNYMIMAAGVVVLALGFFLMAGGGNENPKVFDANEVYSPVRITVAPILIIAGFIIEIVAIMWKSNPPKVS